jgi:hypothetical protein
LFSCIVAVFKIAFLTVRKKLNRFALKAKRYRKALQIALEALPAFRAGV